MKKVIIGILAVAVLAMGGLLVFAQSSEGVAADGAKKMDGKGRHHFGKRGGHGFMFLGIDLTDDQKAQMKAIREANKTQTAPLMEAMKANRQKMQEATANGAFDEGTITVLANEQAAVMAKMTVERERVKSQMFNILTAEQRAKMAEMKAKFAENKGKFGKRGKRGFHKRGGEKPAETN